MQHISSKCNNARVVEREREREKKKLLYGGGASVRLSARTLARTFTVVNGNNRT